ncbi:hypothetical protein EDEG_01900 [Edhazardia aedis USNM 41457]|uniref:ABC1 atypical kinase-like domain-containing protein n=1 Tax=Edhazardia aedis (strain USNM 41457) TaxID=1003232 RepID=J8ZVW0_EDHAE|nr:hypothetical protein EDEG_01900 [Edhazardia aedis USNM 41457]|eukprot:EJW03808.1 hypothetical protein EDEG_01900 [Edhazardia aedis USNM 41457]
MNLLANKRYTLAGSGCVAQVYKAKHIDKTYAVKVLHPNIRKTIFSDLSFISKVFEALKIDTTTLESYKTEAVSQLDLRNEAQNLKILGANFCGSLNVCVPEVYYKSANVLVEEFIEKADLNNFDLDRCSVLNTRFSNIIVSMFLKMVFLDKFVHGDLHQGNLQISNHHGKLKVALFDAGMCKFLSRVEYKNLLDVVYELLFTKNYKNVANLLIEKNEHNCLLNIDRKKFSDDVSKIIKNVLNNCSVSKNVAEMYNVIRKNKIKLYYGYSSIFTSAVCLDGFVNQLSKNPYKKSKRLFWIHAPYKYLMFKFLNIK